MYFILCAKRDIFIDSTSCQFPCFYNYSLRNDNDLFLIVFIRCFIMDMEQITPLFPIRFSLKFFRNLNFSVSRHLFIRKRNFLYAFFHCTFRRFIFDFRSVHIIFLCSHLHLVVILITCAYTASVRICLHEIFCHVLRISIIPADLDILRYLIFLVDRIYSLFRNTVHCYACSLFSRRNSYVDFLNNTASAFRHASRSEISFKAHSGYVSIMNMKFICMIFFRIDLIDGFCNDQSSADQIVFIRHSQMDPVFLKVVRIEIASENKSLVLFRYMSFSV